MYSKLDSEYKWILQICDYFSKYYALYSLKQKTAEEVAITVLQWLYYYSIRPYIWQSDNSLKFKGALFILLHYYRVKVINCNGTGLVTVRMS
jgi:hypothetical protein